MIWLKKTEQTHSKHSEMLTRRVSSTLHGAADRSSSSITYICIFQDCFIHNADVLAFYWAISAFKTIKEQQFRVQWLTTNPTYFYWI